MESRDSAQHSEEREGETASDERNYNLKGASYKRISCKHRERQRRAERENRKQNEDEGE